jgi:hypothetical protein
MRRFQEICLILTGLFAIAWSIVRAGVQSITLDEADTYFWFVAKPGVGMFYPYPNNHILNTLLIWLTTHIFGTSAVTVRIPALLGAVLYVSVCYFLCRRISDRFSLQFPLFLCLVLNPFIMDFMVAARGYSLANAFLLAAIAIPVWHHVRGGPSLARCCVWASLALGLSFTANFSFAFVDLAVLLALLAWAFARGGASKVRIAGWCILPGFCVALLIGGYLLAHWKREDLFYGAQSLGEMTRSLTDASLYRLNPSLGGALSRAMRLLKPHMLPALGILCVCQAIATSMDGSWRDERVRWLAGFAAALAFISAFSVLLHWLAFRIEKLPLPLSRTGIFLVPLCCLLAGAIAAAPARSVISQWLRRGIIALFICLACYFLSCLRLTYFKEYEYDADVKDVYAVLEQLRQKYGVTDVAAHGTYLSSLNFYRVAAKNNSFPPFVPVMDDHPVAKTINVLEVNYEKQFIDSEGLVVIYQGESTPIVIAVKPDGPIPPVRIDREILLRRRRTAR